MVPVGQLMHDHHCLCQNKTQLGFTTMPYKSYLLIWPEGREGTQGGKPREQGNTWKDGWMDRWIEQLVLPRPGTTSTFPLLPSCKKNFDRVKVQFLRREKGYRAKIKIPF